MGPITQNKPRNYIYSDDVAGCAGPLMQAAVLALAGGRPQIDVRHGNFARVREIIDQVVVDSYFKTG